MNQTYCDGEIINLIIDSLSTIFYPSFTFFWVWLIVGHAYTVCDFLQPVWYQKCNLANQTLYQQIDVEIYLRILRVNYQNLILLGLCYFCCTFFRFYIFGYKSIWALFTDNVTDNVTGNLTNNDNNTLIRCIIELTFSNIMGELYFFIMHRFAHLPLIKRFHKLHHEFTHTGYALVGLYCSWQELVFINFPLGLLFPILIGMHFVNVCIFVSIAAINILSQHSFHQVFPKWFDDASYHMKHHQNANLHFATPWTYKITEWLCCCQHLFPPNHDNQVIKNKRLKKSKRCD